MISEKPDRKNNESAVHKMVLEQKDPIFKNSKVEDKIIEDRIPLTVAPEE